MRGRSESNVPPVGPDIPIFMRVKSPFVPVHEEGRKKEEKNCFNLN